jgi:hypothetical protein
MSFEITIEIVFVLFLMVINLILCYKPLHFTINFAFGFMGAIAGLLIYVSGTLPTIDTIDLVILTMNTVL